MLLPLEHETVIVTLNDFANGKVPKLKRNQPLIAKSHWGWLRRAKDIAINLFPKG